MKENELYLKCNLCDDSHKYSFSDKEIQGIEVQWKSSDIDSILLENTPKTESEYIVKLELSITIDLNNYFWGIYLNPQASLNGIESEKDLTDLRFCKCETIEIIKQTENIAYLRVKIIEILETSNSRSFINPKCQWLSLLNDNSIFEKYGYIENFKNFSYINICVEGDLGISVIIEKTKGQSKIVTINEWDFHLDVWNLLSLKLNKEEENRYGIKHLK